MVDTNIVLIRHAEKLDWTNGQEPSEMTINSYVDNHLLSIKGYERANALVSYFHNRSEMQELFKTHKLTTCIAQDIDEQQGWGKSERPRETIWPLLQNDSKHPFIQNPLQLKLYTKSSLKEMVESIMRGDFDGESIIISWCHQQLPEIVGLFGVVPLLKWPKKRFDVTWVVKLRHHGAGPEFSQMPQLLLYGDRQLKSEVILHDC